MLGKLSVIYIFRLSFSGTALARDVIVPSLPFCNFTICTAIVTTIGQLGEEDKLYSQTQTTVLNVTIMA